MNSDDLNRINDAEIPGALKTALKTFAQKTDALMPQVPDDICYRTAYFVNRLVEETTQTDVDTHWWPVTLDLITKAAAEHGQAGHDVVEAARQLRPLLQRHLGFGGPVSLQPITARTVMGICWLSDTLTEPKRNYVAPNAISLAQAHFNPHAWFRAVYAGKAPVGFVMLVDNNQDQEYFVLRFMIAEPYHGHGYGRQAIERLVDYVKTRPGARELRVSYIPGEGSPGGFYLKLGFEHTGETRGEEIVLRLALK